MDSLSQPQSPVDGARDPFRILDLPYTADADDVRRAFRRRARETHPDRGGSTDAFHEIRVAYAALSDDLDGERKRWQAPRTRAVRYPGGLDPRLYPTCPVRVEPKRGGTVETTYDLEARPPTWAPGAVPPPNGECRESHAATASRPAFGVWVVPLDAQRYRCVFGPPVS